MDCINIEITSIEPVVTVEVTNSVVQDSLEPTSVEELVITVSTVLSGIDIEIGNPLSLDPVIVTASLPRWIDYATQWSITPTLIETTSEGSILSYMSGGVNKYRFVPSPYVPVEDAFYSEWDGSFLTGLLARRG